MKIFVGKNDEQYGPFTVNQINESIAKGEFSLEDLGWYEDRNIEGIIDAAVIASNVSSSSNNINASSEQVPSNLVWGILSTLCCCLPLGIVSIVYASKVEGYVFAGDIETAKENSKKAAMWAWISFWGFHCRWHNLVHNRCPQVLKEWEILMAPTSQGF